MTMTMTRTDYEDTDHNKNKLLFVIMLSSLSSFLLPFVTTFMQGVYSYLPKTRNVSRVCNITATL